MYVSMRLHDYGYSCIRYFYYELLGLRLGRFAAYRATWLPVTAQLDEIQYGPQHLRTVSAGSCGPNVSPRHTKAHASSSTHS